MRFVPIKPDDQLDLQCIVCANDWCQRPANLRRRMPLVLEDADANLTPPLRRLLADLWQECKQVQAEIAALDEEMEQTCTADESCHRLREIPGVATGARLR